MTTSSPIDDPDVLVRYYSDINTNNDIYVGIEWERSGIYKHSLQPVPYYGDAGYLQILRRLVRESGWSISEGSIRSIGEIERGNTKVSTEADGRVELAGSPNLDLHALAQEFRSHIHEVRKIGGAFNIEWLPMGVQPLHAIQEIKMIDKQRYRSFLELSDEPFRNQAFEFIMKKANGIHLNLSYTNSENAIRKAQTAVRILPIVGAMFACSPFNDGTTTGYQSYRRFMLSQHIPQRTSLPLDILDEGYTLQRWLDYYLDLPVVYVKRRKEYYPKGSITFRQWINNGYKGMQPTLSDFDRHVKTSWSDLRLRPSYVEYRVVDSLPFAYAMSSAALMKGLLLDSASWRSIESLFGSWSVPDIMELDQAGAKYGLQAVDANGVQFLEYAQELIGIAEAALGRFNHANTVGDNEAVFLEPIKEFVFERKHTIAHHLQMLAGGDVRGSMDALFDFCRPE